MISFRGVSKSFDGGRTYAVQGIDLEVADGETLVLLGSSGSGKSTLLRLVNRLIEPSSGAVFVSGEDVTSLPSRQLRRRIGYVFQGIGLFPHLTASENVGIVARLEGRSRAAQQESARKLLDLVGLDAGQFGARYPDELSGGQQQRVGVARALAGDPDYLLMDEPFGALDAVTRDTLQREMLALKRRLGKTILFVTHDVLEALTLADRIAVMHEGRIEQVGMKKEVVKAPATEFVRELFSRPADQLRLLTPGAQ